MIFVPREMIQALEHRAATNAHQNPCVCTKVMFKGFEISISSDSSHGDGDLSRTDIRVFHNLVDVTAEFSGHILTDADDLYTVMKHIAEHSPN